MESGSQLSGGPSSEKARGGAAFDTPSKSGWNDFEAAPATRSAALQIKVTTTLERGNSFSIDDPNSSKWGRMPVLSKFSSSRPLDESIGTPQDSLFVDKTTLRSSMATFTGTITSSLFPLPPSPALREAPRFHAF